MSPQRLRALFQYKPQNIDELMINAGDLIYVDPAQQSSASEGWVIGTSHRTGCRGFLPENYTERAHEADTWVKHRYSWVLLSPSSLPGSVGRGSGWDAGASSERKETGQAPADSQSS